MANEAGLEREDVSRLVRAGLKEDQELELAGDRALLLRVRQELGENGVIKKMEGKVLGRFISEAEKLSDEITNVPGYYDTARVPERSRRLIATQLVCLYSLMATGNLEKMYQKYKDEVGKTGETIPEAGSDEEFEKKVALAIRFSQRAIRGIEGKDQVGMEIEFGDKLSRVVKRAMTDKIDGKELSSPFDQYSNFELENLYNAVIYQDPVLRLLDVFEAFNTTRDFSEHNELVTEAGEWKQQIREMAALIALGELRPGKSGGKELYNIHLTFPEVILSVEHTEGMWMAPMLMALLGDHMSSDKPTREKYLKGAFSMKYFPYHSVRREEDMINGKPGMETRSWLKIAIPKDIGELLKINRGINLAENLRQMVVAKQKNKFERSQKEEEMALLWDQTLTTFKGMLMDKGIEVPGEGQGQMWGQLQWNNVSGRVERLVKAEYEYMISDLRMLMNKDDSLQKMMVDLSREIEKKMREIKKA